MKESSNPKSNLVLIGLGSNLNPEENILKAYGLIADHLSIIGQSPIYQTPAVGSDGPDYLNSAILAETEHDFDQLRKVILAGIEDELGRVRSEDKYLDRTIDIDILIYNNSAVDPELWTQAHVAVPASHIMPDFENPETGEKISQAASRLLPGTNIQIRSDLP